MVGIWVCYRVVGGSRRMAFFCAGALPEESLVALANQQSLNPPK